MTPDSVSRATPRCPLAAAADVDRVPSTFMRRTVYYACPASMTRRHCERSCSGRVTTSAGSPHVTSTVTLSEYRLN